MLRDFLSMCTYNSLWKTVLDFDLSWGILLWEVGEEMSWVKEGGRGCSRHMRRVLSKAWGRGKIGDREERGKACWEIESKGVGAQATNEGENKTFVDKEKDRKLVRLMRRHMRGEGSGPLCSCLRKSWGSCGWGGLHGRSQGFNTGAELTF